MNKARAMKAPQSQELAARRLAKIGRRDSGQKLPKETTETAEMRVQNYLVKMRNKHDEKIMAARSRDFDIATKLGRHESFKSLPMPARMFAAHHMAIHKLEPGDVLFDKVGPELHECLANKVVNTDDCRCC
jgi:hypothetical protein